jgi:GLPGLI family protein
LKKTIYIIPVLFLLTLFGCGGKSSDKNQGIILYKVTYPKMDKGNFMMDFMPDKMVLKFKDDKYITELTAGMGMFKSNFIVDKNNDQFSQIVKLINKKYALSLEGEAIGEAINKLPKHHVELTGETKKILNYHCKQAIVTVDNDSHDAFTVYYTDQINISDPNWCNQFSEINGVMLEYQYEKYDVCMRFEAKKIKFTEIDDSEFEIDEDFVFISEDEMDKEMQEIFDSFN